MSSMTWHEEPIRRRHNVDSFDCGEPALNEFLRRHACKSHESGGSKTFVAIDDSDGKTILGFYSLSPATIFCGLTRVHDWRTQNSVPRSCDFSLSQGRETRTAGLSFSRTALTPENVENVLAEREIPAFRLTRRAVDRPVQGRGLAGQLLLAAGRRCVLAAKAVGGVALLIEARSERVAAWYASYGAMPLLDTPLTLVLPLKTIEAALNAAGKV